MRNFLFRAFESVRRFMVGRYGPDELTAALLVLSCVFTFLSNFRSLWFFGFISWAIVALAVWRVLSKNIDARTKERMYFRKIMFRPTEWVKYTAKRIRDRKTHRYFKCKNCGASLRVPKGRGKIRVTCPKCGIKTQKKT